MWWGMLKWGETGDEHDHVINSRIPHTIPPLAHTAFIFVCRAKWTSVRLPLQRMAQHPAFLKIGCAERRLKIDPPLITVPLKYLSAQATFKHCSLSLVFYNPYHILVPVMEIPKTMFWIYFTLVLSTWTYSVHIPFPDLRGWSKQVFTADLAVFFVCLFVLYSAVFNAGLYVSLQLQHFLSTFKLMLQQCIFRTFGFFAFHFLSNLFSIIVRCVQMEQ